MPHEAKHLAHLHAAEFLDETSAISGSTTSGTELLSALRRARGVLMECMTALTPVPTPAGITTAPLFSDLTTTRSPIFEASTSDPGWHGAMLSAIRTAMKMGALHFEIEVKDKAGTVPRHREHPLAQFYASYADIEDSWRGAIGLIGTITIYAIQVR